MSDPINLKLRDDIEALAGRVLDLAFSMHSVSTEMEETAYRSNNFELNKHAGELKEAAKIARGWADGLFSLTEETDD